MAEPPTEAKSLFSSLTDQPAGPSLCDGADTGWLGPWKDKTRSQEAAGSWDIKPDQLIKTLTERP